MVKSFEELIVFQKARELTKLIYNLTKKEEFKKDFGLIDQLRRASVSIISNIAEGFERGTKEELLHFLYIAKASCGEVRAQIYVAYDQKYIDEKEFNQSLNECKYVSSLIANLIRSIKVSGFKGLKYKKVKPKDVEEFDKMLAEILAKRKTPII